MHNLYPKANWQELVPGVVRKLSEINLTPDQIAGYLSAIFVLNYETLFKSALFYSLLNYFYQAKDNELVSAYCLVALLGTERRWDIQQYPQAKKGLDLYENILRNPNTYSYMDKISKLIYSYLPFAYLLKIVSKKPDTKNFIKEIIIKILKGDYSKEYFASQTIIAQFNEIKNLFSEQEKDKVLKDMLRTRDDIFLELEKNPFNPELAELYLICLDLVRDKKRKSYIRFLCEGIKDIKKDRWNTELGNEGKVLDIIISLLTAGFKLELELEFLDALKEYTDKLIKDSQIFPKRLHQDWWKLPNALANHYRETFLRNLRDSLLQDRDTTTIFNLYGETIIESKVLEEKSDDIVRILFTKMLERSKLEELQWLEKCIEKNPGILQKCEKASKVIYDSQLKNLLEKKEVSENIKNILKNIAQKS